MTKFGPIDPTISCKKCGASLKVGEQDCRYCSARYDIDMTRLKYGLEQTKVGRDCPDCKKELESIDLEIGYRFIIERCATCLGIFLDKLELEELLKWSSANAGRVNTPRLLELLNCPNKPWEKVVYRNCPVCSQQMLRRNFGRRAGVITDVCKNHGTWLDSGELGQLIKWSEAGGKDSKCPLGEEKKRLLNEKRKIQDDARKLDQRQQGFLDDSALDSMVEAMALLFGCD